MLKYENIIIHRGIVILAYYYTFDGLLIYIYKDVFRCFSDLWLTNKTNLKHFACFIAASIILTGS